MQLAIAAHCGPLITLNPFIATSMGICAVSLFTQEAALSFLLSHRWRVGDTRHNVAVSEPAIDVLDAPANRRR